MSRGPRCSLFIDHGHPGPYPQSFRPKISFSRLSSLLFFHHSVISGWSFQATIGPAIRWATLFLAPLSFIFFLSSHKLPSQIKRGNSVVLPKGFGVYEQGYNTGYSLARVHDNNNKSALGGVVMVLGKPINLGGGACSAGWLHESINLKALKSQKLADLPTYP